MPVYNEDAHLKTQNLGGGGGGLVIFEALFKSLSCFQIFLKLAGNIYQQLFSGLSDFFKKIYRAVF